jgi:uncharacterized membrane protein
VNNEISDNAQRWLDSQCDHHVELARQHCALCIAELVDDGVNATSRREETYQWAKRTIMERTADMDAELAALRAQVTSLQAVVIAANAHWSYSSIAAIREKLEALHLIDLMPIDEVKP